LFKDIIFHLKHNKLLYTGRVCLFYTPLL